MDFQRTALYNWGGVALANLYAGFDSVSREATTSFVGPWSIWQSWALRLFWYCHFLEIQGSNERRLAKETWALWVGAERVSPPIDDGRAMNVARFSKLYEGQGIPTNVQAGGMPDAAIGPNRVKDLVLPSWIVHVYRANGTVFYISITDLEDVYEYPILEDSRPATHGDLNYMILATQPFMPHGKDEPLIVMTAISPLLYNEHT
uniref:Aminotransferase-like plant mobile domain-containing protein n=1 Tax=Fagus sylvatica TaxID=28930 RepID=A0A2N9EWD5_FAGSY